MLSISLSCLDNQITDLSYSAFTTFAGCNQFGDIFDFRVSIGYCERKSNASHTLKVRYIVVVDYESGTLINADKLVAEIEAMKREIENLKARESIADN